VHVLVDEHLLLGQHAAAQQPDKIGVLQLGDELNFRLELHEVHHRARRQALDRDLQPAGQHALVDGSEAALAELVVVGEVVGGVGDLVEVVEQELGVSLLDPPELEHLLHLHGHGGHTHPEPSHGFQGL